MTIKEIEDYINTYRVYPDEYTGKRDNSILRSMNTYHRVDIKNNRIIRREGRINSNGDFELTGLFKFPIDNPEEKVEITDDFEKTTALHFKYTLTKYNEMMIELNHESGVIGPGKNENWNLRDMVSEVEYIRSTYYDKNHVNSKLRAEDIKEFNKRTSRLRYFIRTYKAHIGDLIASTTHNSKYD